MSAEDDVDLTAQSDKTNNIEDSEKSKITIKQQSKNFMIDNLLSSNSIINSYPQQSTFPWSWHSATTSRLGNDFLNNSADKQALSTNLNYVKNIHERDRFESVGKMCSNTNNLVKDFNSDDFPRKDIIEAGNSSADECFGKYDGE